MRGYNTDNTNNKLTVASFFSGGGLLDYGYRNYFDIIWANELNPHAAECYRANIGNHIVVDSIEELAKDMDSIPYADVFIGGPPCQEFSSIGTNKGEYGEKGKLVWTYQQIIQNKKPKAFVMENVMGLARKHKQTLERLIESYESIGYKVYVQNLSSEMYGTAQKRQRVFIVGIRNDLSIEYQFPEPTHTLPKTVEEAIGDLPKPISIKPTKIELGDIPNHVSTWTNPTPDRIIDIIMNPRPNQRVGIRKLDWTKPSHTLTAHIKKDGREFIHPTELRRITVREALRLMGLPDSFVIPSTINIGEQYQLVGNGVAYNVAEALAKSLYNQLTKPLSKIKKDKPKILKEQMSIFDFIEEACDF